MIELEELLIYHYFNQTITQETIRNKSGFDIENQDRLKKKIKNFIKIKFDKKKREFRKIKTVYPKNKSDIVSLIKNAKYGIKIENFLDCYVGIKKDWLDLVKFSGRHRKLIMLKGKTDFFLTVFFFQTKSWIFVSKKTVQNWHNIIKIN
mmetsp:Transcript_1001/g.2181  ORF Transcript_1001/g.2181 Transcript_1001/m.2181 type:complete len:149 (+) Transcript_1001:41-487(+)